MLRTTFATHFKKHGDLRYLQLAMRHAHPPLSLEIYQKEIAEEKFNAVACYQREIMSLAAAA